MQCPLCNHQNRADAYYCDKCGTPLAQRSQTATGPPRSQFITQNASPDGVGWQPLIKTIRTIIKVWVVFAAIIAILVVIVWAIIAYFFVHMASGPPPDGVLSTYCTSLQAGDPQGAYDQYSTKLKSEVSSQQLSQMSSGAGKFIDSCTHDSVQVSGNQATSTLHITVSSIDSPPNSGQTYTYHVILVQDGSNGWKIDSLQSQ